MPPDSKPRATAHYVRIYRVLKEQIASGALEPGARLPSQRVLSRDFDVTLMTLRQAVALLEQEGLVVTRHGAGSYVTPRRVEYGLGGLSSLAQDLARQGLEVTTHVRSVRTRRAAPLVSARLELSEENVVAIERLRLVDGAPVVLQRSQLPESIGGVVAAADLSRRSLYDVLQAELGLELSRADETLHPVAFPPRVARVLRRPVGAPGLRSERVTIAAEAGPIVYDEAFLPGDRVVVSAQRWPSDVTVRYELRAVGEAARSA